MEGSIHSLSFAVASTPRVPQWFGDTTRPGDAIAQPGGAVARPRPQQGGVFQLMPEIELPVSASRCSHDEPGPTVADQRLRCGDAPAGCRRGVSIAWGVDRAVMAGRSAHLAVPDLEGIGLRSEAGICGIGPTPLGAGHRIVVIAVERGCGCTHGDAVAARPGKQQGV